MKVACIMMHKNETLLLDNWVHYHGVLFGYENLYIFDNGSDDIIVKENLQRLRDRHGINVDYSRSTVADFQAKGDLVIDRIRQLEASSDHDVFIPLDCDEFVCVHERGTVRFSRQSVLAELTRHRSSRHALKIAGCYYNCYGAKDRYYYLDVPKTFFAAGAAGHLDVGFHHGTSRLSPESAPTAIRLMHLHNKPFASLRAHAAAKLRGRVASMSPADLKAYRGPGGHLVRYFFMTEADYLRSFPMHSAVSIPAFAAKMEQFGCPLPF